MEKFCQIEMYILNLNHKIDSYLNKTNAVHTNSWLDNYLEFVQIN